MGKITGFLEFERQDESYIAPKERIKNYKEFTIPLKEQKLKDQGARCMDCGIPFCHSGCPLGNLIPDFNDKVYQGKWKEAAEILHKTNNFPEFTGRLCPAPCEEACVLGINEDPVSIENIEKNIVETAFKEGWIKALPPKNRTNKTVAVIGSGPAGLAAAQQLNRAGHSVTVFERDEKVGGLLRYGIPDFKMEKHVIDRRLKVLEEEGISFKTNAHVGINVDAKELKASFDAIVLCGGATVRRSIPIPGAHLNGVTQAMDFLKMNNQDPEELVPKLIFIENQEQVPNLAPLIIPADSAPQQVPNKEERQYLTKSHVSDGKLPKINGRFYQMRKKEQPEIKNSGITYANTGDSQNYLKPPNVASPPSSKVVRKTTFGLQAKS